MNFQPPNLARKSKPEEVTGDFVPPGTDSRRKYFDQVLNSFLNDSTDKKNSFSIDADTSISILDKKPPNSVFDGNGDATTFLNSTKDHEEDIFSLTFTETSPNDKEEDIFSQTFTETLNDVTADYMGDGKDENEDKDDSKILTELKAMIMGKGEVDEAIMDSFSQSFIEDNDVDKFLVNFISGDAKPDFGDGKYSAKVDDVIPKTQKEPNTLDEDHLEHFQFVPDPVAPSQEQPKKSRRKRKSNAERNSKTLRSKSGSKKVKQDTEADGKVKPGPQKAKQRKRSNAKTRSEFSKPNPPKSKGIKSGANLNAVREGERSSQRIANMESNFGGRMSYMILQDIATDFAISSVKQEVRKKPLRLDKDKKKMKLLQIVRSFGTWVQCDECQKWRYLDKIKDPSLVPSTWICRQNSEEEFKSCEAPEEELPSDVIQVVENKFTVGSVVWARLDGYPWWPALVDDDPDTEVFFWTREKSDLVEWYHVMFFDRLDNKLARSWIKAKNLMRFDLPENEVKAKESRSYKKANAIVKESIEKAMVQAKDALQMELKARRKEYCFLSKGKRNWGIPWKLNLARAGISPNNSQEIL